MARNLFRAARTTMFIATGASLVTASLSVLRPAVLEAVAGVPLAERVASSQRSPDVRRIPRLSFRHEERAANRPPSEVAESETASAGAPSGAGTIRSRNTPVATVSDRREVSIVRPSPAASHREERREAAERDEDVPPCPARRRTPVKFERSASRRPTRSAPPTPPAVETRPRVFVETRPSPGENSQGVRLGPIEPVDEPPAGAHGERKVASIVRGADAPQPAASGDATQLRLGSLAERIDRLAQLQTDRQATQLEEMTRLLESLRTDAQLQNLERQLEQVQKLVGDPPGPPAGTSPPATAGDSGPTTPPPPAPRLDARRSSEDTERFSLKIQDAEIKQVLEMLGQLSGLNILVGHDVQGTVTANLQDVTIEQALEALLRSRGYVYQQSGDFLFVMTEAEAESRRRQQRKLVTKVYRPHYVSVKELQALVTPLLTENVGKVAVTNPTEVGLTPDNENAGGDSLTQRDALLVQDYSEVIREVDGIVAELDVPPAQVVIEAMILSVTLTDSMEFGVNFALLGDDVKQLAVSGNGQQLANSSGFPGPGNDSILPPGIEFLANTAGLKYGFIQGDMTGFIRALENIADTNLIASPQLRVLNKQKAQLIIGDRISYTTRTFNNNQTIENVNFLDAGTRLILRPFIAPDGLIRMEVHPERSSATINQVTGLPNLKTTEVTTNVMIRDGSTVVIGGLIEEQVEESHDRVPFLGAIPWVGHAFRNKSESITRNELIVLITPRIVREPEDAIEGDSVMHENLSRADHFRRNLAPINRRNLAQMEYDRAVHFFERGELIRAHDHVEQALFYSKNFVEAIRLRDVVEAELQRRARRLIGLPVEAGDAVLEPLEVLEEEGPALQFETIESPQGR